MLSRSIFQSDLIELGTVFCTKFNSPPKPSVTLSYYGRYCNEHYCISPSTLLPLSSVLLLLLLLLLIPTTTTSQPIDFIYTAFLLFSILRLILRLASQRCYNSDYSNESHSRPTSFCNPLLVLLQYYSLNKNQSFSFTCRSTRIDLKLFFLSVFLSTDSLAYMHVGQVY